MDSRVRVGLTAAAAGLLGLALGGCGSTAATIDPVAQAAVATSTAGGAQMTIGATIELASLPSAVTLSGSGDFNFAAREGELATQLSGLPAAALGALHAAQPRFTELFAKDNLYIQSPLLAGKLPGGASWIKLDVAQLSQDAGLDPQSLSSGEEDPAQVLGYLRASGGTVRRVGTQVLRGTPTTRYRASIDLARAAEQTPGASRPQVKAEIQALLAQGGDPTIPVEVWIDAHKLVRRMTLSLAEAPAGQHVKVSIAIELFDFGPTPTVNPPAAAEVFEATPGSLAALGAGS